MSRNPFYTDMGVAHELQGSDGSVTALPRYAVWKWDRSKGKHQVAEVGEDLAMLRAEHGEWPLVDLQPPKGPIAATP